MKKLWAIVISMAMIVAMMPMGVFAGEAIEIASAEDLAKIGNEAGYPLTGNYELTNDITLSGNWTPIGTEDNPFTGNINGNRHTITGLNINKDSSEYAGLVGLLDGGSVNNIKFDNVNIKVAATDVGAAVGRIINGGSVSSIDVLSGSIAGSKRVGGVVGSIKASGNINNCSNKATVNASEYNVGGIVGAAYYTKADKKMTISGCENSGNISSLTGVGGIVGLSAAEISSCNNTGAITGNGTSIGGIVGEQKSFGSVTGNANTGTIENKDKNGYGTGGIIGWVRYHGDGEVSSYARSEIISVADNNNSGTVEGGNDAGGIVGTVYNSAVITDNTNTAAALSCTTFAAGIAGNYQTTETPAAAKPAENILIFDGNKSETALDSITANCKDSYIYTNGNSIKSYVAQISDKYFTTLEDAIAAANDGDTVKLIKDVECDSIISIKKSIVLDGNGHSIKTTAKRGIWIDADNLNVGLNNFKLIAGSETERGIQVNVNVKGINLKIDSCEIAATFYGINVCSGANVELAITNSKVSAWAALNLWSAEYSVTAEDSTFIGNNDKAYNKDGWNGFGTIVLEGDTTGKTTDHAELNAVVLNNCNVVSESKNGNSQCAFLFNSQSKDNKVYVNGSNTMVNVPETEVLCEDNGSGNELLISAGTFSKDPSKYVVSGYYADKSGEAWTVKPVPYTPSTPVDNVTNNPADKNTTADLTPAVKDNKAETTVDAKTAGKIVDKAVANKSTEVIVDAKGNNTVASSEFGIPEKTVKEIAEKTDANLVIKTDNGKVDLDKAAVKAVANQAGTTGTVKLIVETVKTDADICHVNLKLITSNGTVKDFRGGNVKVTINLDKELAAKELVCVYIDDNGSYTLVEGVLNADGTYTFTTGHFSEYAVMAKAEADKKIAEQLNTLIKEVNLKVRTSKTSKKNIKAVVSGDVKALTDAGYTVKYKFYRSEKKASKYTAAKVKDTNTYINTAGKKGTKYYYKAKALVYDGDKLVGQTVLTQCKYGVRTWSK